MPETTKRIRQANPIRGNQVGLLRVIFQPVYDLFHVIYSCPSGRALIGADAAGRPRTSRPAWLRSAAPVDLCEAPHEVGVDPVALLVLGEKFKWNYGVYFALVLGAVYFAFAFK